MLDASMEAAALLWVTSWIKASEKPKGVSMERVTGPDSGDTLLPHKSNRAAIHSILVEQLLMHSRRLPRQGVPTISWLASRITMASRLF